MHEALTILLRTVGPCTIGRYLGFAQGDGIGEEEWEGQTAMGAKDMGEVARPIVYQRSSVDSSVPSINLPVPDWNRSMASLSDDDSKVGDSASLKSAPIPPSPLGPVYSAPPSEETSREEAPENLPHFYGSPSNKLGEACACWLSRWGVDVLEIESRLPIPSPVPIWSHHGLPADFIRAVISADGFFVRSEIERYNVARKVLDLRRRAWDLGAEEVGDLSYDDSVDSHDHLAEWERDEEELESVFADGIYYTHMVRLFLRLLTKSSRIDI